MNDKSIKKTISLNIAKYRELSGISQKELSQRLGVVPSRISNWETGANCPTIDILFDVCKILGVSINDIYGIYPSSNINLSFDEQLIIKKYNNLDALGKKNINLVLDLEQERIKTISEKEKTIHDLYTYIEKLEYDKNHPGSNNLGKNTNSHKLQT